MLRPANPQYPIIKSSFGGYLVEEALMLLGESGLFNEDV